MGNFGFDLDPELNARGVEGVLAKHPMAILVRVDPDGSVHPAARDAFSQWQRHHPGRHAR